MHFISTCQQKLLSFFERVTEKEKAVNLGHTFSFVLKFLYMLCITFYFFVVHENSKLPIFSFSKSKGNE